MIQAKANFILTTEQILDKKLKNNDYNIIKIINKYLYDPHLEYIRKCEECEECYVEGNNKYITTKCCDKCIKDNNIVECTGYGCDELLHLVDNEHSECDYCDKKYCYNCEAYRLIYIGCGGSVCKNCCAGLIGSIRFYKKHNKRKKYIEIHMDTLLPKWKYKSKK